MNQVVIVILVIFSIILLIGIWHTIEHGKELRTRISFQETMNLTDLPIVTFYNNGRKLNFLLDTGSNKSIINARELNTCAYTTLDETLNLMGLDGKSRVVNLVQLPLTHNKSQYTEVFQITDISNVVDEMKKTNGVNVHGILGNTFFTKYKYVLDFDKLIAYSK